MRCVAVVSGWTSGWRCDDPCYTDKSSFLLSVMLPFPGPRLPTSIYKIGVRKLQIGVQ